MYKDIEELKRLIGYLPPDEKPKPRVVLDADDDYKRDKPKSIVPLIVAICILLLIIIAVGAYFALA